MSDKPKNALAELAERMRKGIYIDKSDKRFGGPVICASLDANDVLKAQRIVAELAKVDTVPDGKGNQKTACFEGCDAIDRCRAIAEKGAEDERSAK